MQTPVQENTRQSKARAKTKAFVPPTPVIQKKLKIGAVNDPYEAEADAIADKVMQSSFEPATPPSSSGPLVQKKCSNCKEELQKKPLSESITPLVQRSALSHTSGGEASDAISQQIQNSKGSGSMMDRGTRSFMESRFGSDFSGVRIHTGSEAIQMSKSLHAQAFTVGNDIYFNQGKYNPSSASGKHLLAHELTHTIQQKGAQSIQRIPTESGIEDDRYDYSTHCGWIDWSHASPGVARRLIQEVQAASDRIGAGDPAPQAVAAPAMQSSVPVIGTVLSSVTPHFNVTRQLSSSEVNRVALRAWQMQSLGFESLQQWTQSIGSSSFSEEDLTSNIIAFYMAVNGHTRSGIEQICDVWSNERSLTHFETYNFRRWGSFTPPTLPSGGSWPFNSITPAPLDGSMMSVPEATFETTTSSGRYSLGGIHLIMQGGLHIVSSSGNTVDISSTSTDIADAPEFSISPLTITNDLQFRWIIKDSSDRRYLMWGTSGSVKHFGNHPQAFIQHRTRDLLRRRGITRATILCRAIAGRGNPGGVQRLFEKDVNFTW
ncbi:DUF4157 domain-containing protein [Aureisphaera galaxeae]|uniref:eCIS core domain-containing protein n=1 Tax=Aureisphaera galaxeae TaxID=1538023 RepID=UPI0023503AF2|nr:DUF4157 domain-containing protein [Aureisphaera galaxeae]MDC8005369.1 DUF4157 domain-containing protein [Aureisphaera galaxeae]